MRSAMTPYTVALHKVPGCFVASLSEEARYSLNNRTLHQKDLQYLS